MGERRGGLLNFDDVPVQPYDLPPGYRQMNGQAGQAWSPLDFIGPGMTGAAGYGMAQLISRLGAGMAGVPIREALPIHRALTGIGAGGGAMAGLADPTLRQVLERDMATRRAPRPQWPPVNPYATPSASPEGEMYPDPRHPHQRLPYQAF